jgi:hypothetical protein
MSPLVGCGLRIDALFVAQTGLGSVTLGSLPTPAQSSPACYECSAAKNCRATRTSRAPTETPTTPDRGRWQPHAIARYQRPNLEEPQPLVYRVQSWDRSLTCGIPVPRC